MQQFSFDYLNELTDLLDIFPHDRFDEVGETIIEAYNNQKQIFVMGNGGSGTTASHFVCDINKGSCMGLEKKFKVICLNDNIPTIRLMPMIFLMIKSL